MKKYLFILFIILSIYSCSDDPTSSTPDTTKPTVSITEPANNSNFFEGTIISIKASASDDNGIKKVEFILDGNLALTDLSEPYHYDWSSTGNLGEHTVYAIAYNNSDNTGESEVISFTVIKTVTDIDGNVYQTIKIGDQVWMAENLKVTRYRNGDDIPNETNNITWGSLSTGAYAAYNNENVNVDTYGLLYNWYAVDDSRNIAPEGWHVPTDEEWKQLEMQLGMSQSDADNQGLRGTDEGNKMKATSGWNGGGNGTNESGFSALPGGYRDYYNGTFGNMGYVAYFWSSTEYYSFSAWSRILGYDGSSVYRSYYYKQYGFSVRLVRD